MNDDIDNPSQANHPSPHWEFTFLGGTSIASRDIEFRLKTFKQASAFEQAFSLTEAKMGDRVSIVGFRHQDDIPHLSKLGIIPGMSVHIISNTSGGSVMIDIEGECIGLGIAIADRILVTDKPVSRELEKSRIKISTYLWELPVGSKGYVVGYDHTLNGYRGKLLSMGLTVGAEFTLIRHTASNTAVEIEVQGIRLRLTKPEANALCVESVDAEVYS